MNSVLTGKRTLAIFAAGLMLAACTPGNEADSGSGDEAAGVDLPTVDIPFEQFTLDNGLRVVVHEDRKAPIVAVSVWYHVGSRDEPEGKTGFAHLFEHLMFNGSENYDDDYFKPFEQVGATGMNGTTWLDRTNYFETVPTPALDMALWMESDRMGHLLGAIDQDKLDEQRGVVQNEKRQGDSQPYGLVRYRLQEGILPSDHPYHHSTIGSLEDLENASLEDVHEWFQKYYGAANTVLVLAGDINAEEARPLVEHYFGDIEAGPPLTKVEAWVPDRDEATLEVMQDRVPQARIIRRWAIPPLTSDDTSVLELAADVLGGGQNSRLYRELVYDRQLATSVSADVEEHELMSFFDLDITVAPDADAEEVSRLMDGIMEEFLENGPTAEELNRAKTTRTASFVRGLEQIGGFGGKAVTLARGTLYAGDPAFYARRQNMINATGASRVVSAAREWLSDGHYQLTVVPYGDDFQVAAEGADRSELPAVGEMPDLTFPEIETATLDNGVEVYFARREAVPIVRIAAQFDAGYAADHGGKLGTSGFAVSMLDDGTETRSALEIAEEAELLGAEISTGSTLDTSSVSLNALTSNLTPSLDLFADVVRNPAFDAEEMERLRGRWLARIQQEKVQPVSIALRTLPPLLYGEDHPYGIPLTGSGTEESINSLTPDDLRAFHQTWLTPGNMKLFVVGDTTLDEIVPELNRAFGDWQVEGPGAPEKNLGGAASPESARVIIVDRPGLPQATILAGQLVPPMGDEDQLLLETMNGVLGGSFTSRINMNLREDKGWSYGAFTFALGAQAMRPWVIFSGVQVDKTKESIQEIRRELDGFLGDNPATPEELQKIVNDNTNSLPGQFETGGAVLSSLMSSVRYGRDLNYPESLTERYQSMTVEDVRAEAREVLTPDRLLWVIIGDRSQIEEGIRELNIGPVEVRDAQGNRLDQ